MLIPCFVVLFSVFFKFSNHLAENDRKDCLLYLDCFVGCLTPDRRQSKTLILSTNIDKNR